MEKIKDRVIKVNMFVLKLVVMKWLNTAVVPIVANILIRNIITCIFFIVCVVLIFIVYYKYHLVEVKII